MTITKAAIISKCEKYRYSLTRKWGDKPMVLFIALNPSTADAQKDDPTIRRLMGYAKKWGYGGFYVANLFAFRTTSPNNLKAVPNAVGKDNDWWIDKLASKSDKIILCWGNGGVLNGRGKAVLKLLSAKKLYCFGLTQKSQPLHPLYLSKSLMPKIF